MTTVFNNANGIASGTAVTTSNSGGTSGTAWSTVSTAGATITAQSTSAYEGASGYEIAYNGTTSGAYLSWVGNGTATTTRYSVTFMFKVSALPNSEEWLFNAVGNGIGLRSDGKLNIRVASSGGAVTTTASAISTNTWYFVQWASIFASSSTGRVEARIYAASDGSALLEYDSGATLTNTVSSITTAMWGRGVSAISANGTAAYTLSLDLIGQSNDWLGTGLFPTAGQGQTKDQDFNTLADGTAITTTTPANVTGSSTVAPSTKFDFVTLGTGSAATASVTGPFEGATAAAITLPAASGSSSLGSGYVGWTSGTYGPRGAISFAAQFTGLPVSVGATPPSLLTWGGLLVNVTTTGITLTVAGGSALYSLSLTTGVWYQFQVAYYKGSASSSVTDQRAELRVYRVSDGSLVGSYDSGYTITIATGTPTGTYFGSNAGTNAYSGGTWGVNLDALRVRTDLPGGYPSGLVVPTTPEGLTGSGSLTVPSVYKGNTQFPQSTANTKTNTFEGLTNGTAITTANSGGASGTAIQALSGTLTATTDTNYTGASTITAVITYGADTANGYLEWLGSALAGNPRYAASFFVKMSALPPSGAETVFTLGSGAAPQVCVSSSGQVYLGVNGAATVVTGSSSAAGSFVANQWYFVQVAAKKTSTGTASDDELELRVYNGSTGTALIEFATAAFSLGASTALTTAFFGRISGSQAVASAHTVSFDNIAYSGDHPYTGAFPYVSGTRQVSPIDQYADGQPLTDNFSQTVYGTFWMVNQTSTNTITAKTAAAYQGSLGARSITANVYGITQGFSFASGVRGATSVFMRFADLADIVVNRQYLQTGSVGLIGGTATATMRLQYQDSTSASFFAATTPAWEANTWYFVQLAVTPGTSGKIEFRLWKQAAGVWSKILDYSNTFPTLQSGSNMQALSWGRSGGVTGSAIDYDYPAWDTAAPFGYPGIALTESIVTLTTTATVAINAQLSATALTELSGTTGLGVNVALSATASSDVPGAPTFTGSGSLTASGVATLPTITTADLGINLDLGGDAQADFPTADFWHATFEGSDTAFSATVGSVTTDSASAFDGSAGMAASGTTNAHVAWPATGTTDTSRKSASVYFKIDSLPSEVISILQHGSVASVAIKPDGTIGFNAPGMAFPLAQFWSAATLSPDRWYFLQFAVTNSGASADRGELRVYDIDAETTIIEVDEDGLNFGVSPAPLQWYFGRAGTTTNPITVTMDHLFATDMYRTWDFPGVDSAPNAILGFGHGSSYYQDFDSLSDGTGIVVANPGSPGTISAAVPAPNSGTSENEPSDYFVYNQGTGNGNTILATTDSPFQGTAALRMSLVPGGGGANTGWITLSSFGTTWGTRGAAFSAFRLDSLPTYTDGSIYADEFVNLVTMVLGGVYIQPRTGRLAYQNNTPLGFNWVNGTAPTSPPLEPGVWYVLRYATHLHVDGVRLRDRIEVRNGVTGEIVFFIDTGFYDQPTGFVFENTYLVGVAGGHWDSPWSVTWDQLILRQDWQGAGYPGPLYPPFASNDTTADLNVHVALDAFSPVDATVDLGINLDLSAEVESAGVVLDDTEFVPVPYGTVEGYIDGITIGGAASSFTMSTEFTQYASSDLSIPPVTSGSPIAAVDLAWQLAGNMRCSIPEGNYWSLQGHEAGFDLKTKEILKGRDESVYRLFDETFDKNGIPQGSVYRKWKVVDSYTSSGWYGWASDAIYSTEGRGSSPTMTVGARTNIICTARPGSTGVKFMFGTDLGTPGFGPNNGKFAVGKWFTVQISTGDILLEGQWRKTGATNATDFSKSGTLGALAIGPDESVQVLISVEWVTDSRMDVTVIVANDTGTVVLGQSMTQTALDSYAAQWQHTGPIRALYQHTIPRAQMSLGSFAGRTYEAKVPFESRLPSMGIDVTAPFIAFSGSIWDYLTQICVARQVDIRNENGTILLTPMIDVTRQSYVWEPVITPSFALGMDNVARKIEIIENLAEWRPLGTLYDSRKATGDSFSVTPGQDTTFNVTVDSAASLVYTPAPVGGISTTDPTADAVRDIQEFQQESRHIYGAYTIQGTLGDVQNHTVPAKEWIAYGGAVSVKPIDSATIEVTITGANIPGYTGDFLVGLHGDQDYTLLRLVGDGLHLKTKTKTFQTGANPKWSPSQQASQITNVAATTPKVVNTLIARASTIADGPSITLTAAIAMAEVSAWGLSLGTIPGSTILYKNIQWRILSASVKNSVVTIDARPYTTYKSDYWATNWKGRTYGDFISFWTGKRWDDFKVMPLSGPVADWGSRGPISKYTLYPAPDTTQVTPALMPADDLLPSRDLLPSGGVMPENVPPTWPGFDVYPGGTDDPYAN